MLFIYKDTSKHPQGKKRNKFVSVQKFLETCSFFHHTHFYELFEDSLNGEIVHLFALNLSSNSIFHRPFHAHVYPSPQQADAWDFITLLLSHPVMVALFNDLGFSWVWGGWCVCV